MASLNYNIYHLLKGMLDDISFARYCQKNGLNFPPLMQGNFEDLNDENHLMLPSRTPIITLLRHQLQLHQLHRSGTAFHNAKNLGGLGGILIEGPVGLGKSELVKNILTKLKINYDYIAASLSVKDKENCLLDAFNNGKIAWIDELNTSAVLEQLLNALLMGKTPQGHAPKRPGFMLIVTQNPSNMLGRRPLSPALLRRLLILKVDDYTREEMVAIFKHRGMDEDDSIALALAYQKLKAEISFRDALKLIPDKFKSSKRKGHSIFNDSFDTKKSRCEDDSEYESESESQHSMRG